MYRIQNIKLSLERSEEELPEVLAQKLGIPVESIRRVSIAKKAVDARKKQEIHFVYTLEFETDERVDPSLAQQVIPKEFSLPAIKKSSEGRPLVVGFGPAGMFAALFLAQAGKKPLVIERGCDVDKRLSDVSAFWKGGNLDPQSNVQFGEGGAGTFSDGKLTTGTKDIRQDYVRKEMVAAGAPEEILYLTKPHIGTDRLHQMVKAIRNQIIALGGQVMFQTQLVDWVCRNGKLEAAVVNQAGVEREIPTDGIILAIGHSARDTFELLYRKKITMRQKQFSMGVRIEHSKQTIDRIQYGSFAGHKKLGAADYKLACHLGSGRGVYTFCMCPGGVVVAAASEKGGIVTNGMSNYLRDGVNSNSALLVGTKTEDFGSDHPLAGMWLQREVENACFQKNGNYFAPAQLAGDFMNRKASTGPAGVIPSYLPGVTWCSLDEVLPAWITESLREGLVLLDRKMKGFLEAEAVLTAPETRSSSPVTILRNELLQSNVPGIYPCGEGAGYAGGIMSSAVDGVRCAEAYLL